MAPPRENDDSSDASSPSDDDSLVLEGELIRNPEVSSSSDDDSDADDKKPSAGSKRPASREGKVKKKQKKAPQEDLVQVNFIFCDMAEKFFHALKSLLHSSGTVYQPISSQLSDIMIENPQVGTILTQENDDSIYGFASVVQITDKPSEAVQQLTKLCLKGSPADRRKELEVVMSGTTKKQVGFLIHGRMVNLPLEVTQVLHEQLVLDMDWASEHAEMDYSVLVRLAPCQQEGKEVIYKYFDDEVMAGRANLVYTMDAPKTYSNELKQLVTVIVMSKAEHRAAMTDLKQMIGN